MKLNLFAGKAISLALIFAFVSSNSISYSTPYSFSTVQHAPENSLVRQFSAKGTETGRTFFSQFANSSGPLALSNRVSAEGRIRQEVWRRSELRADADEQNTIDNVLALMWRGVRSMEDRFRELEHEFGVGTPEFDVLDKNIDLLIHLDVVIQNVLGRQIYGPDPSYRSTVTLKEIVEIQEALKKAANHLRMLAVQSRYKIIGTKTATNLILMAESLDRFAEVLDDLSISFSTQQREHITESIKNALTVIRSELRSAEPQVLRGVPKASAFGRDLESDSRAALLASHLNMVAKRTVGPSASPDELATRAELRARLLDQIGDVRSHVDKAWSLIGMRPLVDDQSRTIVDPVLNDSLEYASTELSSMISDLQSGTRGHVEVNVRLITDILNRLNAAEDTASRYLRSNLPDDRREAYQSIFLEIRSAQALLLDLQIHVEPSENLSRSIETLGLSVRVRHVLHRVNIKTIRDLVRLTGAEILNYRHLGQASLLEIKGRLSDLGFRLAQEPLPNDARSELHRAELRGTAPATPATRASSELRSQPLLNMEAESTARREARSTSSRARSELREFFDLNPLDAVSKEHQAVVNQALRALRAKAPQVVNPNSFKAFAGSGKEVAVGRTKSVKATSQSVELTVLLPKAAGAVIDLSREIVQAQGGAPLVIFINNAMEENAIRALNPELPANIQIFNFNDLTAAQFFFRALGVTQVNAIGFEGADHIAAVTLAKKADIPVKFKSVKSIEELATALGLLIERISTDVASRVALAIAA